MRIKSYLQLTIMVLLFSGGLVPAMAADEADSNRSKAQQMIDKAEQARKKAASAGGEWRDTAKILKNAKDALEKGDTVEAMKSASEAHKQAVLGYQQAMSQQELQLPSYLKYE